MQSRFERISLSLSPEQLRPRTFPSRVRATRRRNPAQRAREHPCAPCAPLTGPSRPENQRDHRPHPRAPARSRTLAPALAASLINSL
eukprot:83520-Chlamydomonas_euryale.AAC.3